MSGTAAADETYGNHTVEVGAAAGLFLPSEDHELYDPPDGTWAELDTVGLDIGARVAYLPIPFIGAEVEVNLIPIGADGGGSVTIGAFRGHLVGQIPLPGPVTPFAIAGAGWMVSSSDDLGGDTDPMGYLGLGAKFHATDNLAIRVDGRWINAPKRELMEPLGSTTSHFEVLLGVSWLIGPGGESEPLPPPDPDGDGYVGAADACPNEAGVAPDGCPPRDTDGDGLLDDQDQCPNEAEVFNAYQDEDGCPDEIPDSDGDGLKDPDDLCPDQPEDMDGFEDADGCPDLDNDDDGVVDAEDACPNEAGPVENRGCPDTDRDGDGVVDRLDNCPDEPGTEDNFGCKKKQLVRITTQQLEILDKVYFRKNRARIQRRSRRLLNNVASVIQAHPEIGTIRIEGHTDSDGDDAHNKQLSQERANAVRDYLIEQGVSADRLVAVGFGEERPIASNESRDGKAENRRVEFNIEGVTETEQVDAE